MNGISLLIQSVSTLLVFFTLLVLYRQLRAMHNGAAAQNALAVINLLRDPAAREARGIVFQKLKGKPLSDWTEDDRRAALLVCTNYDIAGILIRGGLAPKEPIVRNWAASIVGSHKALEPYIAELHTTTPNKMYGVNLGWLRDEAIRGGFAKGV